MREPKMLPRASGGGDGQQGLFNTAAQRVQIVRQKQALVGDEESSEHALFFHMPLKQRGSSHWPLHNWPILVRGIRLRRY